MFFQFFVVPYAVEQEESARFNVLNHLIFIKVSGVVASNEVSLLYVVGGLDWLVAESQVRNRYAAGFFGVILEVSLRFLVSVVADDLDGVLVCTDGTVSTKTPEFTSLCALRSNIRIFGSLNGKVCNIVKDGKSKFFLRLV